MGNFEQFTGLYELSKTLRFELRLTEETENYLISSWNTDENWELDLVSFFDKDQKKFDYKKEILKDMDKYVLLPYIKEVFSYDNLNDIDLVGYSKRIDKLEKEIKDIKDKKEKSEKNIELYNLFNALWYDISSKFVDAENKCKSTIIKELKEKYKDLWDEEKVKKLLAFNDVAYFRLEENRLPKFEINRKKKWFITKLKKWSIAERVVENFKKFKKNIAVYNNMLSYVNTTNIKEIVFNGIPLEEITNYENLFSIDYYKNCFLQDGIDLYNTSIWELRSLVNEVNQKILQYNKNSDNKKISTIKFITLDKQILWEGDLSTYEFIESDEDFENKFSIFQTKAIEMYEVRKNVLDSISKDNLSNIYLRDREIMRISGTFFKNYNILAYSDLNKIWIKKLSKKNKKKYEDWKISLQDIVDVLSKFSKSDVFSKEDFWKPEVYNKLKNKDAKIEDQFVEVYKTYIDSIFEEYNKVNKEFDIIKEKNSLNAKKIHDYCESVRKMYMMLVSFFPMNSKEEKIEDKILLTAIDCSTTFYWSLYKYVTDDSIISYYNQFRNYITKKPYDIKKVHINFEKSALLNGWTMQEWWLPYWWNILKKDINWKTKYYLWIINKNQKMFNNIEYNSWDYYEVMEYLSCDYAKVIKLQYKNTYWKAMSEIDFDSLSNKNLQQVMDNIMELIKKYAYDKFSWIRHIVDNADKYNHPDEIEEDFKNSNTYSVKFNKMKKSEIDEYISKWSLMLFEIYSKDFSDKKKENTRKNLNTMYFEELFSKRNLEVIAWEREWNIFELDGFSKLFFRKKSVKKESVKPKEHKKDTFKILKNWRYAKDKILFHLTMRINYWKPYEGFAKFNEYINSNFISQDNDINYIGIDRWEKFLAYAVVVDKNWKILEDVPLNGDRWIYKDILVKREEEMMDWRRNWKTIWKIKELKEWYTAWAVKKITDLSIKYNAVIVLEDLSGWFKNIRKKIDRQVYNKFEHWLLKKLNYVCDKKNWVDKWIQLTPYFYDQKLTADKIDFNDQLGILLYTNPAYTSQTCPDCWFVKSKFWFNPNSKKEALKQSLEDKLVSINYDNIKNCFEVKYCVDDQETTLYTSVKRLVKTRDDDKKYWKTDYNYNMTDKMKDLFSKFVEYKGWENVLSEFFNNADLSKWDIQELSKLLNILIQLRNSNTEREALKDGKEEDFIACPRCLYNSNDSSSITEKWKTRNISKLSNADANGAYNIARKGIIMVDKIKNSDTSTFVDLDAFRSFITK